MHTLLLLAAVYGTLTTNEPPQLVHAPYSSCVDTIVTTNETRIVTNCVWKATASLDEPTANRLGWKLVLDEPPAPPSGHYAVAVGWEYRDWTNALTRIYRTYAFEPLPPEPARRIYKYDLSSACIEYGEITNLVGFISADVGVKWMWDAAEILVEDDPYFIAATNEVIQSGLIEEAKVKAILDRAYELGQLSSAN